MSKLIQLRVSVPEEQLAGFPKLKNRGMWKAAYGVYVRHYVHRIGTANFPVPLPHCKPKDVLGVCNM